MTTLDSRPTEIFSSPKDGASGGTQLAGRHSTTASRGGNAAGTELTDRPRCCDTHRALAVGASSRAAVLGMTSTLDAPHVLAGLTPPLVVAFGGKQLVVVGASDNHVFALDADTGERVWLE